VLNVEGNEEFTSAFSTQHSAIADYHPQQSVLNLHIGHRHTACIRNISLPHRSQITLSPPATVHGGGGADGFDRIGCARALCPTALAGSGIGVDYKPNSMDLLEARERMVETQIAGRGVADAAVLAAMRDVPRHLFVPEASRQDAYEDRPLPIGEGQTISQPYIVAAMSAALAPGRTSRVLEIGAGSGYQAAILARLAGSVVTIERHAALADRAAKTLSALGIANVRVVVGDGSIGYPAEAPYDRILVTAGAPAVPEALKLQLSDGGRLVIPVGSAGYQRLLCIERRGPDFTSLEGEGCVFVPLIGRQGWPELF
jgi:protein-L-isoaspartate(D-aspartate) O-methyltransferase